LDSVCGTENPSFIVPNENGQFLFAISETKKGDYSAMVTFQTILGAKPALISEVIQRLWNLPYNSRLGAQVCHFG